MLYRFLILIALGLLNTSCLCLQKEGQPERPMSVAGWQEKRFESGIEVWGELLLKSGESSDNGKVGVKLTEVLHGDPCAHPGWIKAKKITLQFFRPSDRHIFCQQTFMEGMNSSVPCSSEANISVIRIIAINSKEGWAVIEPIK